MSGATLLALDEPSMGLSPLMVSEIFSIIGDIRVEGVTVLVVEQNARMALELADMCYVFETGKVVLEGPTSEFIDNPIVKEAYLGG